MSTNNNNTEKNIRLIFRYKQIITENNNIIKEILENINEIVDITQSTMMQSLSEDSVETVFHLKEYNIQLEKELNSL
jgi:hypothetical protein